jgi:hypothetical protein
MALDILILMVRVERAATRDIFLSFLPLDHCDGLREQDTWQIYHHQYSLHNV